MEAVTHSKLSILSRKIRRQWDMESVPNDQDLRLHRKERYDNSDFGRLPCFRVNEEKSKRIHKKICFYLLLPIY